MALQPPLPEKITQLQCDQCNRGLQTQFLGWLAQAFKYQPNVLARFHHEIEALVGLAQFKYTIAASKPQPGDYLQNIEFKPLSNKQKILWLILSVILPYLLRKISDYSSNKDSTFWKRVQWFIAQCQRILTVLQFVNYAIFILKGKYRTLTQRILNISMKFIDPENKRILNFALMNRMLVWQVYELFLKTVLPELFAFASGPLKNLFYLSSYLQPDTNQQQRGCVFCTSSQIVMPQQAHPCLHKACYYCSKSHKTKTCPLCSQPIDRWAPLLR